ncbi:MAG: SIS domain-containing protein [Anaerolineaceae bacterium]|nr:SIS domain-containing protein [Anaerolineaceae bacterium]
MELQIPKNMQAAFERFQHPYFMYESLNSTPEGLQLVLSNESMKLIQDVAIAISKKDRVHLVGNGTSYFNAIFGGTVLNNPGGISAVSYPAFGYYSYPPCDLNADCAVIGISHSGASPATVDAVEFAKSKGALTVGISDYENSALLKIADKVICSENKEVNGPKTRSYVASTLRALLLAAELGEIHGNDLSELKKDLAISPEIAKKVLRDNEKSVKDFAESRIGKPNGRFVFVGAGLTYPTALEAALKVVETMLLHATAWELEEAIHGNWVSQKEGELLVVFAPRGPSFEKSRILISGMKMIGVDIWVLTDHPNGIEGADYTTILPENLNELTYPVYAMLPVYQFIYFHALAQGGLHPDRGPYGDPKFMNARLQMRSWR